MPLDTNDSNDEPKTLQDSDLQGLIFDISDQLETNQKYFDSFKDNSGTIEINESDEKKCKVTISKAADGNSYTISIKKSGFLMPGDVRSTTFEMNYVGGVGNIKITSQIVTVPNVLTIEEQTRSKVIFHKNSNEGITHQEFNLLKGQSKILDRFLAEVKLKLVMRGSEESIRAKAAQKRREISPLE